VAKYVARVFILQFSRPTPHPLGPGNTAGMLTKNSGVENKQFKPSKFSYFVSKNIISIVLRK